MDNFSPEHVLYYMLSFILLENVFEIYLSWRQVKVYKNSNKVPKELKDIMKSETFEKARHYGIDREQFGIFKGIVMNILIVSFELYFGIIALFWHESQKLTKWLGGNDDDEILVSCAFLIIVTVVGVIKDMPFKVYGTFVVEERHGFNKQTIGFFIKDQIKYFFLNIFLSVPISSAIVYIVQIGGQYFFIWLWGFVSVIMLLLMTIYPIVIAPLFDKYRPLDNGPLRTAIETLAAKQKFPLTQLYVVEGSKRSAHSNAYFYGFWGSKRIVLFDTLLINKGKPVEKTDVEEEKPIEKEHVEESDVLIEKDNKKINNDEGTTTEAKGCEDNEVLAVLAHELGHWKLGHLVKNIIIGQVHLFLMFGAFSQLFHYGPLYESIGFPIGEKPILVGLILIFSNILAAYNALISFAMTVLSRKFEYEADQYAKELGYSRDLKTALVKLNIDNLGFPVYDWLYSVWNHSHPTLLQRMKRLDDEDEKKIK